MPRAHRAPLLLLALGLAACGPELPTPDASFDVTVTGIETDCTTDTSGFQQSYTYNMFFDGSETELRIGDDFFAAGTLSGCTLSYESPVWLEERGEEAFLRWQILGEVEAQFSGGGCAIEGDYDLFGEEEIVVVESEDESVPQGCTYLFEIAGTLKGG